MNIKNTKPPLVSIITVNYNQLAITVDLVKSLKNITYPNVEIIVVDNASPDDNPQLLKKQFPEIILITSEINLGFAGGNNLGIKASAGEYLMFINNDTEVPADFLQPLVKLLENNRSIGMVSPKIKFHWNPDLVQYAGFSKMNPYTIRNKAFGYHKPDTLPEINQLSETASVHGAAMLVPRRIIHEVGMMAEDYFLYYEEHDWAERIKRAGYKIYYEPKSFILHKESVSTGKDSPFKTYYLNRNRLLFARRNISGFPFFISILFQVFIAIPKNTLQFLFKGKLKHLSSYWKAIAWNLTNSNKLKT